MGWKPQQLLLTAPLLSACVQGVSLGLVGLSEGQHLGRERGQSFSEIFVPLVQGRDAARLANVAAV